MPSATSHRSLRCVQSISLGGSSRRSSAQPICDIAYNPEEIKARLSGVPVYTVANKQNEFILVAGEVRRPSEQFSMLTRPSLGSHAPCNCYTQNQFLSQFTVRNLQSGDQVKQLGLIFMSEADANALVEKVGPAPLPMVLQ